MTFAVLPAARHESGDAGDRVRGPQSFLSGDPTSGFAGAALDAFGIRTVDAALGAVELEPSPYVENSLGAVQGGVVATIAERAGELAFSAAAGEALAPVGLQLTYLALAREGPIRSEVSVLGIAPAWGSARVELFDAGAADRRTGRCASPHRRLGRRRGRSMELTDEGRSVARYVGVDLREVGDWAAGEVIGEASSPLHDHLPRRAAAFVPARCSRCATTSVVSAPGSRLCPTVGWSRRTSRSRSRPERRSRSVAARGRRCCAPGKAAIVTDIRVTDAGRSRRDHRRRGADLGRARARRRPAAVAAARAHAGTAARRRAAAVRRVARRPRCRRFTGRRGRARRRRRPAQSVGDRARRCHGRARRHRVGTRRRGRVGDVADAVVTSDVALHFLSPSRIGPCARRPS